MPETLYHVSFNCDIIEKFTPRIPIYRHYSEDNQIKRISLSGSIEGALTGVPGGGSSLDFRMLDDDISFLTRVYEFDTKHIKKENIIIPEKLYQDDLVRDAEIAEEYWVINQELFPSKTYLINILYYEEELLDDISYSDLTRGLEEEKNCINFDWGSVIDGTFTKITNLRHEIIPEEKRSGLFQLNHEIVINKTKAARFLNKNIDDLSDTEVIKFIEGLIENLYPKFSTHVDIIAKDNELESDSSVKKLVKKLMVVGQLDTSEEELSKDHILEVISQGFYKILESN